MAWKRMVLEIGMGTDIRGGDSTKAAVRALRDALWHNSLGIAEVLGQPRDLDELARSVCEMRDKMRKHLLPSGAADDAEFHLKQGAGGIVDIEFMVQYAVLAWSHREPELARWSDNVRILEALGRKGLFEQPVCEALTQAYLAYRSAAHQLSLQQQPDVVPAAEFADHAHQLEKSHTPQVGAPRGADPLIR